MKLIQPRRREGYYLPLPFPESQAPTMEPTFTTEDMSQLIMLWESSNESWEPMLELLRRLRGAVCTSTDLRRQLCGVLIEDGRLQRWYTELLAHPEAYRCLLVLTQTLGNCHAGPDAAYVVEALFPSLYPTIFDHIWNEEPNSGDRESFHGALRMILYNALRLVPTLWQTVGCNRSLMLSLLETVVHYEGEEDNDNSKTTTTSMKKKKKNAAGGEFVFGIWKHLFQVGSVPTVLEGLGTSMSAQCALLSVLESILEEEENVQSLNTELTETLLADPRLNDSSVLSVCSSENARFLFRLLQTTSEKEARLTALLLNITLKLTQFSLLQELAREYGLLRWSVDALAAAVKPPQPPLYVGYETDLMHLLCHLCWRNRPAQDSIREWEAIPLILNRTMVNDLQPFLQQWAIFCIRVMVEDNADNVKEIESYRQQGGKQIY